MRKHTGYILLLLCVVIGSGCRDEYVPPVQSTVTNYLVVEGNVDPGPGTARIRLSRSTPLDNAGVIPEDGASLTVEDEQGNPVGYFTDNSGGFYTADNLGLAIGQSYRLRIQTANGSEYLTDPVKTRSTPPIDSVSWRLDRSDVALFVSTHDDADENRHFRWEFDETWQLSSYYGSHLVYQADINDVRERAPNEYVAECWKYDRSSAILIGNTLQLQSSVVHEAPIFKIYNGDERIGVRYSILVHQYAMDQSGYNFYQLMKRNTDELGSVFSPLPSEIRGNIHCISNPGEYVLGYVTMSTHQEKRIFISRREVGTWHFGFACDPYDVPNNPDSLQYYFGNNIYIPVTEVYSGPILSAYQSGTPICVDCTMRGGNPNRPSYW